MTEQPENHRLKRIGAHIKQLRVNAGYSNYVNFANDHEMEPKQYWRLEAGQNFSMNTLLRILDIHNLTMKEFFSELD